MRVMKILYANQVSENVKRLSALAECLGIETELINIGGNGSFLTLFGNGSQKRGIALDVASLKHRTSGDELRKTLVSGSVASLLILVTDNDEATNRFIRDLTAGEISGVDPQRSVGKVSFPASGQALNHDLSSQIYPRQSKDAITLRIAPPSTAEVVMELNGAAGFAHFRHGRAEFFIWSTTEVFDMNRRLAAELEFELASDEYIPGIIFLRSAFGQRCWHNPVSGAGIVIDDPLLKENYGFIDFRKLLESARKHQYHVTLAFIPWNYWRSRRKTTQLFRDYSDCFDICAHGCDHTDSEFRHGSYDELLSRNFIASNRMATHALRTGMESAAPHGMSEGAIFDQSDAGFCR